MVFGHRTAFGVRAYRIWCTAVSQMEYGRIANGVRCENRVMLPFVYGVWVNGHYVVKGSKYIRTRCESCELMGIIGGYALCRPLRGSLTWWVSRFLGGWVFSLYRWLTNISPEGYTMSNRWATPSVTHGIALQADKRACKATHIMIYVLPYRLSYPPDPRTPRPRSVRLRRNRLVLGHKQLHDKIGRAHV